MKRYLKFIPIFIFLILISYSFAGNGLLKDDDLRNREFDENYYTGKRAELFLDFIEFKDNEILFRDVYGENLRVSLEFTQLFSLKYKEYIKRNFKLISGYDFERYGEKRPDLTVKQIIQNMAGESKLLPLSVIIRFKILEVKKSDYWGKKSYDFITIKGRLINMVI